MLDARIQAFVEYVLRPLSEDWRQILEELRSLNIGLTAETVKDVAFALGLWHLTGELIRACSYVAIAWLVCHAVVAVW